MKQLRERCPMNGTDYRRVIDVGLSADQADRWAVRCGLHPAEVWPEIVDEAKRPCAECSTPFFPHDKRHRFCTPLCSTRQWQRNRYHTDPDFRARRIASAARYYAECGDYVRARVRQRARSEDAA
jgi:hypothetical protein